MALTDAPLGLLVFPPPNQAIRLTDWAALTNTPLRTAYTWAAEGVLDGGENAQRAGVGGWKALRTPGRPRLWFVVRVPLAEPETEQDVEKRIRIAVLRGVAEAIQAALEQEGVQP